MIKITECPRDAMQGIAPFIPTEVKIAYLNKLLQIGFDRLDFGSFVSPKAIPQLRDTRQVLSELDLSNTKTALLAIVANLRGATDACEYKQISYLGFPFSIAETFQRRNTNSSIATSYDRVKAIADICQTANKTLIIYLSMAYGNPYGDEWSIELVLDHAQQLSDLGVTHFMLADTTGISTVDQIGDLYDKLQTALKQAEIGIHLHSTPATAYTKLEAAYLHGCKQFDTVLGGYGGCPMAADKLTGNIATEILLSLLEDHEETLEINNAALNEAIAYSDVVFKIREKGGK